MVLSVDQQIAQLETALAAQEAWRPRLGEAAVDAALVGIRAKLESLRAQRPTDEGLAFQLDHLTSAGLIKPEVNEPDLDYLFKHALTQDAAYQSLLLADRKTLHRKTGEAIERLFPERLGDLAGILAEHFERGEAWDKAANYFTRAGEADTERYARVEASANYLGALAALQHLPQDNAVRLRQVDTVIKLVSVSFVNNPERNLTVLAEAEAILKLVEPLDRLRLARVRFWLGHQNTVMGRVGNAIPYFQQVLPVAQEFGDEELISLPATLFGRIAFGQGRLAEASTLQLQAAAPLEKAARLDAANWAEWILNMGFLGLARVGQGEVAAGMAEVERPLALALAINNNTGITIGHIFIAFGSLLMGDMHRLMIASRAALEFAHKSNELLPIFHAHGFLAWAESRAGQHAVARQHFSEMKAAGERLGGQAYLSDWFAAAEVEMALNEGQVSAALTLAERAATAVQAAGGHLAEGWIHRTWAQALMAQQRWAEAEAHASQSLALFEAGPARLEAARTRIIWGRLCQDTGQAESARAHFEKAAAQFEASGLAREWEQAKQLLTERITAH